MQILVSRLSSVFFLSVHALRGNIVNVEQSLSSSLMASDGHPLSFT